MMVNTSNENKIDFNEQKPVKLGEIVYTNEPGFYNLLGIGSCLAVFMFDLKKGRYMIAHTVLPKYEESHREFSSNMPARYTDIAIKIMVNRLVDEGSNLKDIQVKMVGGSQIYNDHLQIGKNNILAAYESIKEMNLSLVGEDVGGEKGRSAFSFNKDGTITVRKEGKIYNI